MQTHREDDYVRSAILFRLWMSNGYRVAREPLVRNVIFAGGKMPRLRIDVGIQNLENEGRVRTIGAGADRTLELLRASR